MLEGGMLVVGGFLHNVYLIAMAQMLVIKMAMLAVVVVWIILAFMVSVELRAWAMTPRMLAMSVRMMVVIAKL